ncbi:innexin inx2 isoform X3 [Lepeophtheirus salmonis]|uniref:innexin inx2 isoform X3 n=1 Tax=Lepeophtheirus salmonis TaxID=72036 RepID=UPI003AF38359
MVNKYIWTPLLSKYFHTTRQIFSFCVPLLQAVLNFLESLSYNDNSVNEKVLEQYCWMYSTFNIPLNFRGVCAKREYDGTSLYNSYYQWVPVFLIMSAILFYAPRGLWLSIEGGLMKFLAKGTRGKIIDEADIKRDALIKTFQDHLHNKYNSYAFWFLFCEGLNFVVVISEWFITNRFIKYHFFSYGPSVLYYYNLPPEERLQNDINPMCEAFPRIASCKYARFGSGGGPESLNAICILGLNMINDKIFLVLWFWYFFLTLFGCLRLIYRVIQVTSSSVRFHTMRYKMHRYFRRNANIRHIEHYIKHCSFGDWFVLYQMSRNMNRRFFASFVTALSRKVNPDPELLAMEQVDGETRRLCTTDNLSNKIYDLTYDAHPVKTATEHESAIDDYKAKRTKRASISTSSSYSHSCEPEQKNKTKKCNEEDEENEISTTPHITFHPKTKWVDHKKCYVQVKQLPHSKKKDNSH